MTMMNHIEPRQKITNRKYLLTEQQLAQIEAEIKSSQPLTPQLLPIDALVQHYSRATIAMIKNSEKKKMKSEIEMGS